MFEDKTPEALKQAMLESIQAGQGLSPLAGGFADGVVGPAAVEMSKLYMALSAVPSMLFVDESSGGYIDLVGRQYYDITRRAGTTASCAISFVGTPGLVVPQGTAFLTGGGLSFSLAAAVTLGAEGTGSGRLEADAVGSAYNVEAGAVDRMYVNLAGLTSYTNGAASGGTDPESDAALLARIQERVQQPPHQRQRLPVPAVGHGRPRGGQRQGHRTPGRAGHGGRGAGGRQPGGPRGGHRGGGGGGHRAGAAGGGPPCPCPGPRSGASTSPPP